MLTLQPIKDHTVRGEDIFSNRAFNYKAAVICIDYLPLSDDWFRWKTLCLPDIFVEFARIRRPNLADRMHVGDFQELRGSIPIVLLVEGHSLVRDFFDLGESSRG